MTPQAMGSRLHAAHLLPQLLELNGAPVTPEERVRAGDAHGAGAEALAAARRRWFPDGELDDGGGAVPPKAAGLVPSAGEEEGGLAEPGTEAYAPGDAAAAAAGRAAGFGGIEALAAALAAALGGTAAAGTPPLRQLQLLRAAWRWVATHCAPPPGAHPSARGAAAATWEVGWPLFGAEEGALELEAVRLVCGGVTAGVVGLRIEMLGSSGVLPPNYC
jgi:hypothetical protein